jgi:hypothetical protein
MAIQGSGQIKLTELATEFGGTAPYSLKAYYRGGGRVPANNTNVPASGAIGLKNFYNAVNRIALTVTFDANSTETSLTSATVPGYIAGITDLTVYVSSGVYVYSTSTSSPALTLATGFVAGDTVSLINNGYIMGKGGYGGDVPVANTAGAGVAGGIGGPALSLGYGITLTNNSYIAGGGGGGGSGTAGGGGGAGGGESANRISTGKGTVVAGGAPGAVGNVGTSYGAAGGGGNPFFNMTGAGASGGRILPGTGGAGSIGTFSALAVQGGAGGAGGGGGGFLYTNSLGADESHNGGAGGSASSAGSAQVTVRGSGSGGGGGGGWGAAGGAGRSNAGGAGGKAIALNGYAITYNVTGTLYGAVS